MSKKLIALVEVLMVVSLFCTGFASWTIVEHLPDSVQSGSVDVYNVESYALSDYGIALTSEADGITAKSFGYVRAETSGGNAVYQSTNSTLSMLITVDTAKMASAANDYREQALLLTCSAKDNAEKAHSFQSKDEGNNNQAGVTGYYSAPKFCKLTLNDYPNRYIMVDLSNNFDAETGAVNVDTLSIEIPLVQLYNLAKDYMAGGTCMVIAELEFEPRSNANLSTPCSWTYSFTAKIK